MNENLESFGRGKFFILIWEKLYISVAHLFLAYANRLIIIAYNLYVCGRMGVYGRKGYANVIGCTERMSE